MMTAKKQSFEELLNELQQTAESLKSGGLTLDESIRAFERGAELYGKCNAILDEAKQRIEIFER